jgi:putative membrane protein
VKKWLANCSKSLRNIRRFGWQGGCIQLQPPPEHQFGAPPGCSALTVTPPTVVSSGLSTYSLTNLSLGLILAEIGVQTERKTESTEVKEVNTLKYFAPLALVLAPICAVAQTPAGGSGMAKGPDTKFAMMVAQTDLAEIKVSNMALQKSSSDDVKKLAQKLVDDHTKTSDAMKEIASSKGLTLPTEPDAKHKALAMKLESESGDKFDKDFIAANSADHHKVVAAFQKESSSGTDPEIKAFATKFLPAIQEHTQMIDQMKGKSKGM